MPRAKAQRMPSSEKIVKFFSLQAWLLGAKNFVEVVLLNILSVRTQNPQSKILNPLSWGPPHGTPSQQVKVNMEYTLTCTGSAVGH